MTDFQNSRLEQISKELSSFNDELHGNNIESYYLELDESKDSIVIIGNAEGLVNLATSILDLALSKNEGQHFHFGKGALENCNKDLEILFRNPS